LQVNGRDALILSIELSIQFRGILFKSILLRAIIIDNIFLVLIELTGKLYLKEDLPFFS